MVIRWRGSSTPLVYPTRVRSRRMPSVSERLIAEGRPLLELRLAHPTVTGIGGGDLADSSFRAWLEQDYLFLLDFVRVFCRLAWQAPD